jgi:hypothetical protein
MLTSSRSVIKQGGVSPNCRAQEAEHQPAAVAENLWDQRLAVAQARLQRFDLADI